MPTRERRSNQQERTPTGYVLRTDLVRRLRMHAAATGKSAADILDELIERNIPDYGAIGKGRRG